MNQLAAAVGGLRIVDLDADAVAAYIQSMPVAARTRQNVRLRLSKFFQFCKSKKWVMTNPCSEIQIKVRRGDVTVMGHAEVERLLRAAEASGFKGVLVPYVALLAFAGLRPHEAQQLAWADVDLENRRSDTALLLQQVNLRRDHALFREKFQRQREAAVLTTRLKGLKRRWRTSEGEFGARSERVWDLAQFLFCPKTRREIYDPNVEELREDLFIAAAKCTTLSQFRWVQFCIALRTTILICNCIRAATSASFGRFVPAALRQWWTLFR